MSMAQPPLSGPAPANALAWGMRGKQLGYAPSDAGGADAGAATFVPVGGGRRGSNGSTTDTSESEAGNSSEDSERSPLFSWEVRPEQIEILRRADGRPWKLGSGAYGEVYKALFDGVEEVALKIQVGLAAGVLTDYVQLEDVFLRVQGAPCGPESWFSVP